MQSYLMIFALNHQTLLCADKLVHLLLYTVKYFDHLFLACQVSLLISGSAPKVDDLLLCTIKLVVSILYTVKLLDLLLSTVKAC